MKNFVEVAKKIVCVGRNYALHAKEMGYAKPDRPIIFMKPTSAFLQEGAHSITAPDGCEDLHHEVELAVVFGKRASRVKEAEALDYVAGYALALDMTARDIQTAAKNKGEPWLIAKGFDTSCPISHFLPKEGVPDPNVTGLDIWVKVNGAFRQQGNTKDMLFSIPFLIEYVTRFITMEVGDVLLTGTPEGVGALKPGDKLECGLGDGLVTMRFSVGS